MTDRHIFNFDVKELVLVLFTKTNILKFKDELEDEYGISVDGIDTGVILRHKLVCQINPLFIPEMNTILANIEYRLKLQSHNRAITSQLNIKATLNDNLQPIVIFDLPDKWEANPASDT